MTRTASSLELPFFGDPDLAEDLFLIRPDQLSLAHSVESFRWLDDEEGDRAGLAEISGWAYLVKVDLADVESTVTLLFRNERTQVVVEVPTDKADRTFFPPPVDDDWCDYQAGTFAARVDLDEITSGGEPTDLWEVLIRVSSAGFTVTEPVTQLVRGGSAGVISARTLPDGTVLAAQWRAEAAAAASTGWPPGSELRTCASTSE